MSAPTASIVVVSHNEAATLRPTVDSLCDTTAATPVEIIVVDDQSDDGSTDFLAAGYRGVTLLRTASRGGVAGARNHGALAARAPVVVFSDAHVLASPGWLEPLLRALDRPRVAEVAPTVSAWGRPQERGYGFTWRSAGLTMAWLRRRPERVRPVPFICGCFLAVRRSVFLESGGFDAGLQTWGSEDAELSLRLWRLGYRCLVVPQSEVAHLFRRKFPYQVRWDTTLHNILRMAVIHLGPDALKRVVEHYRAHPTFGAAWALLLGGDTWEVRDALRGRSVLDGDEFVARFAIGALT